MICVLKLERVLGQLTRLQCTCQEWPVFLSVQIREKHTSGLAGIKAGTLAVCKSSVHFTHTSNIWCTA